MAIAALGPIPPLLSSMAASRRGAIAAWTLAIAALALLAARAWRIDYEYSIDFQTYWLAGSRVLHGDARDLYSAGGGAADGTPAAMGAAEFKNLPIVAAAFAPLALVEYASAKRIVWWLSLLSLGATAWVLGRYVLPEGLGSTPSRCALAFAPIAAMAPAQIALRHGQTTPFVTLALAAALAMTLRTRPAGAGATLAAACLIKFPPLGLLGLDVVRRRTRAVAVCLAVLGAVLVISVAAFGTSLHRTYAAGVAEQAGRVMPAHNNQSIAATATRLLHDVPASEWTPRPLPFDARAVTAVASLLLLGGLAYGLLGPGRRPECEHAAVLAASIVVLPVAWDHYFLMLAPASIALAGALWRTGELGRPAIAAPLAAGAVLLALPTPSRLIEGASPPSWPVALALSHYAAGAVLVLGVAVAALRRADA